jgi:hypothetical protein
MYTERALDLHGVLDHGNHDAVLRSVGKTYAQSHPGASFSRVKHAFHLAHDLYSGRFPGYVACRTGYHDLRHTIDVFVASVRLLDGGVLSGRGLSAQTAEDVLVAALLHDCGYIQETGDEDGTGAKYTKLHVVRSVDFAKKHAPAFGLSPERAESIGRLILGTDLALEWKSLSFSGEEERTAAAVLASADLLGQMADRAYLEKLLFLYYEFREAGIGGYATAFDILRKTSSFYDSIAERLNGPLGCVSYDAKAHFAARCGEDRDLYRDSIQRQMTYLSDIMLDDTANFRRRLRRIDLEQVERAETARLTSLGVVFA